MNSISRTTNILERIEKRLGDERAGLVHMLLAIVTYMSISIYVKLTSDRVSSYQVNILRGFFHFMFSYMFTTAIKQPLIHPDRKIQGLIILRNVLGSVFNISFMYMVTRIPFSEVMVFLILAPLMISFIDFMVNHTIYRPIEIMCLCMGVFGLSLIISPDLLLNLPAKNRKSTMDIDYAVGSEKTILLCLFTACVFLWCYSNVLMKSFGKVNGLIINLPFGIILSLLASIGLILNGETQNLDLYFIDYLNILIFVGINSFLSQLFFQRAFQKGKPGQVSMLLNLQLVITMAFELVYLGEKPVTTDLVGAAFAIAANIIVTLFSTTKKH